MATWTGNGPNGRTFVSNIKTGERSRQVDLETHNHSEIREMQQKLWANPKFCVNIVRERTNRSANRAAAG